MPRVVIIGGGISGLVSGIYAQQNGFDTEIYEKMHYPAVNVRAGKDMDIRLITVFTG